MMGFTIRVRSASGTVISRLSMNFFINHVPRVPKGACNA